MASPSPALATRWPSTTESLAQLLEVAPGSSLKCHGYSKHKPTCNFDISNESTCEITVVLKRIVNEGRLSPEAKSLLEDLSSLVLCQKHHQWQAPGKYKDWIPKLEKLRPAPTAKGAAKSTAVAAPSSLIPSPPSTPEPPETARPPTTPSSTSLPTRGYFGAAPKGKPFHVDIPQLAFPTTPTRPTRQAPAPLPTPSPEPPVIRRDIGSVASRKHSVTHYVDSPATRELNAILAAPDAQIAETNARLGIKPKAIPAASMSPSPRATIQPTTPPTPQPASRTIVAATNAPASGPVTRSRPLPTLSKPSLTQHTFAPYVKVRSLLQIDTDIRDLLLAGLDPKDTGRSGWVYGFRFPAAHTITAMPKPHSAHDSPDAVARRPAAYIKIGYTGNLGQRMCRITEQCGYAPQLQFSVPTRHYLLVEGLVHLELDGTRRRETVPCPSCQVRHIEWFEVDVAVARRKVEAWRDWVAREPFEGRTLKKEWAVRLRMVKIGQEGQWEWFVEGPEVPRT
ncbi:hypothetical protein ACHAQA_010088 [Verticillium albo-atrum]